LDGVLLKNPFHDNKQITALDRFRCSNGIFIETLSAAPGAGLSAGTATAPESLADIQTREPG